MFSEYRDRISQLKTEDAHFARLLRRHTALDQHVRNMESNIRPPAQPVLDNLKREKLKLTDALYAMLRA